MVVKVYIRKIPFEILARLSPILIDDSRSLPEFLHAELSHVNCTLFTSVFFSNSVTKSVSSQHEVCWFHRGVGRTV
jgi:branched-subunit amino acid transport protein